MNSIVILVLAHIACVESSFIETKLHPDKCSYGYFGLTENACKEVSEEWPPETPEKELDIAYRYLELMNLRFKCNGDYWKAAEYYHGGSGERRAEYAQKLSAVNSVEALEKFHILFPKVSADNTKVRKLADEIANEYSKIGELSEFELENAITKLENRCLQLADEVRDLKNKIKNQRRHNHES